MSRQNGEIPACCQGAKSLKVQNNMNKDMNKVFKTQRTLTFREADPANVMFFANVFALAHDAFEKFVIEAGFSWQEYFQNSDFAIPLRHAESDFLAPFFPGETYDISAVVLGFGQSSFKMRYTFSKDDKTHAVVTLVHAVFSLKTREKIPLPQIIKTRFEKYLSTDDGAKA